MNSQYDSSYNKGSRMHLTETKVKSKNGKKGNNMKDEPLRMWFVLNVISLVDYFEHKLLMQQFMDIPSFHESWFSNTNPLHHLWLVGILSCCLLKANIEEWMFNRYGLNFFGIINKVLIIYRNSDKLLHGKLSRII